jgi:uncharacterized protein YrrD
MLRRVKELHGATIHAFDGDIGRVDEFLFDDEQWAVRYMIVDTGDWLEGRKALIAPIALGALDWDNNVLNVNITRSQVEGSPGVETHAPLSRQFETDYHDYFGWPYYWGGMGLTNATFFPGGLLAAPITGAMSPESDDERARDHLPAHHGDIHLRSTKEVTGYAIVARDGHLGHVDDFIVDDESWRISYLAVDTSDWWPAKKVLIPPDWIGEALWPERNVTVELTRDQVQNSPEWNPRLPIGTTFQYELAHYYARQRIDVSESAEEIGAFAKR